MLFTTPTFLFIFFPLVYLLVQICSRNIYVKNLILLLASFVFFYWGEPNYIYIILFSMFVNYLFGYAIEHNQGKKTRQKWLIAFGVTINLSLLFFYKYYNFFQTSVPVFRDFLPVLKISLPLGISFFTFHGLTYIIDVYRRNATAAKSPIDVGLYILFFPQLIAGPIVRYKDIYRQLRERIFSNEKLKYGIRRFILGLFKKMVIANMMAYVVDDILSFQIGSISPSLAWLAMICYAFQIFFDFSAYSDMAIGLAKMFGFDFNENFNYPYIASSVQDFWRRWHISLSTFFRDYLYIPLGGNRKGNIRTILNLFIVFFLTGFWHGAGYNFIFWGLYHGFFLAIERFVKIPVKNYIFKFIGNIYTLLVVLIGWVFFRIENPDFAISIIKKMFYIHKSNNSIFRFQYYFDNYFIVIAVLAILFSMPFHRYIKSRINNKVYQLMVDGTLIIMLCWSLLIISSSSYNPFIYFRF